MAGSIDDQEAGHIHVDFIKGLAFIHFCYKLLLGEKSSPDLLCDSASFALLHISVSYLIKQCSFTCINMPKNAANRASKLPSLANEISPIILKQFRFLLFLCLLNHMLNFFLIWLLALLIFFFLLDLLLSLLVLLELSTLSFKFLLIFLLHVNSQLFQSFNLIFSFLRFSEPLFLFKSLPFFLLLPQPLLLALKL